MACPPCCNQCRIVMLTKLYFLASVHHEHIPISSATVFSQMKVKNRLRNHLSDISLPKLMRLATKDPELTKIFLDKKSKKINCNLDITRSFIKLLTNRGGGGGIPVFLLPSSPPPPESNTADCTVKNYP